MKLCRCNNCYSIMFDHNPSDESYEFTDEQINNIDIREMKELKEKEESHWGCPQCNSDGYLMDIDSPEMLKDTVDEITN